jgi:NAD(P)-dependent dehydrogenase (short-subunit alcohol dehydrogenase family)
VCDITRRSEITSALEALAARFGQPTGLVNNAGLISLGPFESISDTEWQKIMQVNLKAPLFCSIEFALVGAGLEASRSIVNIGSVAAVRAMMNRAHYCASKSGVITLTRGLALELAEQGIRVNCIHPKGIESGMSGNWVSAEDSSTQVRSGGWLDDPKQKAVVYQSLPIGRHGQPSDVANAVSFLLSERSSYINGACLDVDGGYLAGDMFTA